MDYNHLENMLEDHYESALLTEEHDLHLAFDIDRVFKSLDSGTELADHMADEADTVDEFPLLGLFKACEDWYVDRDYEEGTSALDLFDECIDECRDLEWMDVAAVFFVHKINLRASFDGHEPVDELNDAFSFLKQELETVSSNWITTLVELADEYAGKLSDDDVENWIELCEDLANQKRDAQSFQQERLFVWHRLSLRDEVDAATEADQERLIESFEEEAAVKGRESENLRATVLESALRSCIEFLSEEKKRKWKREALEARRTGINEMVELPLENELENAAADEARDNVDRIVEWVNQGCQP